MTKISVQEKGPWIVAYSSIPSPNEVGSPSEVTVNIQSEDFTHDVSLKISGDWATVEEKIAHAQWVADKLNGVDWRTK